MTRVAMVLLAGLLASGCAMHVAVRLPPVMRPIQPGLGESYGVLEPRPRYAPDGTRDGLVIGRVAPSSALANLGVMDGDVVLAVDEIPCQSIADCRAAFGRLEHALASRWPFTLQVDRQGQLLRLTVAHEAVAPLF